MKSPLNKLLFFVVLLTTLSCNKDGLTKATHKGANTFSCKVNGKIFKPISVGGLFNDNPVLSIRNNAEYDFGIDADNQETSESIDLENPFIKKTGVYKFQADHPNRGIYTYNIIVNINDPGVYTTDSTDTGELTITHCDTINHIYSGTFYFTAKDPNTGKAISVTDGRFDLKE